MAYQSKRMDQVRKILENYLTAPNFKELARVHGVSKNTIRKYVRRCENSKFPLSELLKQSDQILKEVLYKTNDLNEEGRVKNFMNQIDYWIKELHKTGVTRQLLWDEYKASYPSGFGYSQFCERLKQVAVNRNYTIQLDHKPGHEVMLDFAGKKMNWIDRESGEVIEVEILAGVLPFSQYTFVIALPSQKMEDFTHGINQVLLHFGGCPKAILSDNLKSYVTKPSRYEPTFNELCVQLSEHYKIDLSAARVRKPKDKASVENVISTVYNRIYGPLRNEEFYSLEELNKAIQERLKIHNEKPFQKREGSRKEIFEKYEKHLLYNLPTSLFEIKHQTMATIQKNYHAFLGEEKNYYSVHYKHVGKRVKVLYTQQTVEIFDKERRIAVHRRLHSRQNHRYQTVKDHMPDKHQIFERLNGYTGAEFASMAKNIGPMAEWAIGKILLSRIHEEQSYKSCLGVLSLATTYGKDRLELACKRCIEVDKVNYQMLKNILKKKLDQPQENLFTTQEPDHKNIRGPEAYQ